MASTEVRSGTAAGRSLAWVLAGLAVLAGAASVLGADVYGKPLRGLTPVPVRVAVTEPERFTGLDIRVAGTNAGPPGKAELKDGDAVLPILTDGSFTLPERLDGKALAAEGSLRRKNGVVVFVATGVEVTG